MRVLRSQDQDQGSPYKRVMRSRPQFLRVLRGQGQEQDQDQLLNRAERARPQFLRVLRSQDQDQDDSDSPYRRFSRTRAQFLRVLRGHNEDEDSHYDRDLRARPQFLRVLRGQDEDSQSRSGAHFLRVLRAPGSHMRIMKKETGDHFVRVVRQPEVSWAGQKPWHLGGRNQNSSRHGKCQFIYTSRFFSILSFTRKPINCAKIIFLTKQRLM